METSLGIVTAIVAVYEGNAGNPSIGNQSIRNDVGKRALKSIHGKYLSAQPDGRAEWNRAIASDWEFFELGERDGRKITLRSAHGKYVSAQPDGTVQINRDHAPPTGWGGVYCRTDSVQIRVMHTTLSI